MFDQESDLLQAGVARSHVSLNPLAFSADQLLIDVSRQLMFVRTTEPTASGENSLQHGNPLPRLSRLSLLYGRGSRFSADQICDSKRFPKLLDDLAEPPVRRL